LSKQDGTMTSIRLITPFKRFSSRMIITTKKEESSNKEKAEPEAWGDLQ
jgi:hypothetical protein